VQANCAACGLCLRLLCPLLLVRSEVFCPDGMLSMVAAGGNYRVAIAIQECVDGTVLVQVAFTTEQTVEQDWHLTK